MGCCLSKPAAIEHLDLGKKTQDTPSPPAPLTAAAAAASLRDASFDSPSYDTQSAASLVTPNGIAPVVFFGILNDNSADLSLANRADGGINRVARAVHCCDDSTTGIVPGKPCALQGNYKRAATHPLSRPSSSICDGATVVRGSAMSMPYSVLLAGEFGEDVLRRIFDEIEAVFESANSTVNTWNPQSDVSRLNETIPGKATTVSPELASLLDIVDELCELTEGRFDPTACIIKLAWTRFMSEHGHPPLPSDLSHLRFAVGWKTRIKRKYVTSVTRHNTYTFVDTDGVAKGYVVDLLFDALSGVLAADGIRVISQPSLYVDWAGDIRARGMHPSGRPWRTAVMKPPSLPLVFQCWADGTLSTCLSGAGVTQFVDLVGGISSSELVSGSNSGPRLDRDGVAIATSGDYYQISKFGYHHIVNPAAMAVMKAGSRTVGSVSVMATSCALADGLATAAMTCDTAGAAAQLLKRVVESAHGKVLGYCVVGRGADKKSQVLMSSFFKAAHSDIDTSRSTSLLTPTSTTDESTLWRNHPVLDQVGRRAVVERCARVTCTLSGLDGIPVGKVDSLSSLSLMNAEPYVSFLLSAETAKTLPTEGQAFSLTLPTDDFAGIHTPSEPKLRLRIVQTMQILSPEGLDLIIVAAVSEAIMGSCQTMRLTYNGKHYAQPISDWPTERSFAISSVVARTKEVLTRLPAGIWVIATDAADGTKCGLTVSSVASSATSPSILTFNLLQTSTFYASFCGVGTVVHTFLLAAAQATLSDKYVKTCDVSAQDMTVLRDHATLSLDAVVEQVSHVLDHLLVICRVRQVVALAEGCRDCQSPLLRVDRAYTKLGRVGLEAAPQSFHSHVSKLQSCDGM